MGIERTPITFTATRGPTTMWFDFNKFQNESNTIISNYILNLTTLNIDLFIITVYKYSFAFRATSNCQYSIKLYI